MEFFAVYISEAHPTDGWRMSGNDRAGIKIEQARNFQQRVDAAMHCCGALNMSIPMVVDGMDNSVGEQYSGFPDRLYVIDRSGKVAYKGGRGPFGFLPREMEQTLLLLLLDESAAPTPTDSSDAPGQ